MCQNNRQRLVAGKKPRQERRQQHGCIGRGLFAQNRDARTEPVKQTRLAENAGIGRRDHHDHCYAQYREDTAAVEHCADLGVRRRVAPNRGLEDRHRVQAAQKNAQHDRCQNARRHRPLDLHAQERQRQDEHCRQAHDPVQRHLASVERPQLARRAAAAFQHSKRGIDAAAEEKRHKRRFQHAFDVIIDIRLRQLAHKQRAR